MMLHTNRPVVADVVGLSSLGCLWWQTLPQTLPRLPIGPLPSFRVAAQVARALRAGTNGFRPVCGHVWLRQGAWTAEIRSPQKLRWGRGEFARGLQAQEFGVSG